MGDVDWTNFFINSGSNNYLEQQFASVDSIVSINSDDLQKDMHIFKKLITTYNNIQKQLQDIEIKYLRAFAEKKVFEKEINILDDRNITNILQTTSKYLNPIVSYDIIKLFDESKKEMHAKIALTNQEMNSKINEIIDIKTDLEGKLDQLKNLIKIGCEAIDFDELQSTKAVIKNLECPICTTTQVDCIVSDCGHTFCH